MFRAGVLSGLMLCSALAWAQAPDDFDDSEFEGPPESSSEAPNVDDFDEEPETSDAFEGELEAAGDFTEAEPDDAAIDEAPRPLPTRGPGSLAPRRDDDPIPTAPSDATEAPPPPPPAPGTPGASHEIVSEASIREALRRRANAAMLGDLGAAELATDELLEIKRNLGLRNIPVGASLLLHDARAALASDRVERAVELAEAATRLAPDMPATHWTLATALARFDPTQVVQIGGATLQAARAWIVPFRNAVTFWVWVLAAFGFGFVAASVGFTAIQLGKYLRYLAHDVSSRLTGVFGIGEFALLALAIISVPFALGAGIVTSVAVALGIVFAYQMTRERIASVLILTGLAATPFVLEMSAPLVLFHGSNVDALVSAHTENLSPGVASRLDGLARDEAGQRLTYARINAHRARQRGDLDEARRWYEVVVREAPSDPSALNNLAILQFLAGDQEEARANFEKAARSDRAEPRLNYSLLLADEGQFSEADALLVEARRIDPELTEAFTSLDGVRPPAQRFVEVPVPDALLWARLFEVDPVERRQVLAELWYPVGGNMPPLAFVGVVLAALGLGLVASRYRSRLSIPCSKCGRPAPGTPGTAYCEQCISVFVSGVAVEPRVRQKKEVEVRRYQRRRRWIERLLSVTGLGLVVGDRPLLGLLFTFFVAFCVGAIVLLPLLGVSAWAQPVGPSARILAIVTFGALGISAAMVSVTRSWER